MTGGDQENVCSRSWLLSGRLVSLPYNMCTVVVYHYHPSCILALSSPLSLNTQGVPACVSQLFSAFDGRHASLRMDACNIVGSRYVHRVPVAHHHPENSRCESSVQLRNPTRSPWFVCFCFFSAVWFCLALPREHHSQLKKRPPTGRS